MRNLPVAIITVLLISMCLGLSADPAFADGFRPDGKYLTDVPTPAEVLGFELTSRPARYVEILAYAEALAAASNRVTLAPYATSHEGRDLLLLTISSPENMARLEEIRKNIETLADPRISIPASERDRLLSETPAVAYLAYGIHGDELSSCDAALRVAYELAAGTTADIELLLQNLVILVDPTENPDGRERILAMYGSFRGAVPNPDHDALNHTGFWPWGRGNHYLFDLNRDWFSLVHPESRGRAGILRTWHPQLVVDSHEMGFDGTYLFNPPRDPFNPNLPTTTLERWSRYASAQAGAFDRYGWSYYTRDWNEEFFPGYGSALALYQGATGILYEQARTSGQIVRKPSERVATFHQAVQHQFTSSLANLGTLAGDREELLRSYRAAREEAISRGRAGNIRAFYFAPTPDPVRAAAVADRLTLIGIEVERLPAAATLRSAHDFWEDGAKSVRLPAGSYRIRLDQPDGLLARAILEPHTLMPDSSLAKEREHLERQKESRVYDTTAWSFLLASGIDAWWSPTLDGLDWQAVETAPPPAGTVAEGASTYGWIFDGTTDRAVVLAAKLASRGHKVRVGKDPFRAAGRDFPRGSFLIRLEDNTPSIAERLRELVAWSGVEVIPVATARINEGPDLGVDDWQLLPGPRVAIVAGSRLDFTSVGAAWHQLDREFGLRASLIDVSQLSSIGLDRYNVLVLPHAWGGGAQYKRIIDEQGLKAITNWVEEGGTLIALAGGAEFIADSTTKLTKVRLRSQALDDYPAPQFGLSLEQVKSLEVMQSMGLGADGSPTQTAGLYQSIDRQELLGVPGPGSPLLGPGTWAYLGAAGDAARERGPLKPVDVKNEKKAAKSKDSSKDKSEQPSKEEEKAARKKADDRLRRFLPSGAILRVDLDPEFWLAYGCGDKVPVMMRRTSALLARDPVRTAGRFAAPEVLQLGGLLWPEAAGRISQTAYATREARKKGQVILFAYDPNFRGYFWGSGRLFLNAVVLGPGLGTERTIPW
jgi:hypothetical protein